MKKRTKVKSVRLTIGELAAMKRAAVKVGIGVGDWMRARLLDGLTNVDDTEAALDPRQLMLPVVRNLVPAPAGASKRRPPSKKPGRKAPKK
jgi:hypothetical protein